jgi:hypothetical protein
VTRRLYLPDSTTGDNLLADSVTEDFADPDGRGLVSLAPGRTRHVLAQFAHLSRNGADNTPFGLAVEVRVQVRAPLFLRLFYFYRDAMGV